MRLGVALQTGRYFLTISYAESYHIFLTIFLTLKKKLYRLGRKYSCVAPGDQNSRGMVGGQFRVFGLPVGSKKQPCLDGLVALVAYRNSSVERIVGSSFFRELHLPIHVDHGTLLAIIGTEPTLSYHQTLLEVGGEATHSAGSSLYQRTEYAIYNNFPMISGAGSTTEPTNGVQESTEQESPRSVILRSIPPLPLDGVVAQITLGLPEHHARIHLATSPPIRTRSFL